MLKIFKNRISTNQIRCTTKMHTTTISLLLLAFLIVNQTRAGHYIIPGAEPYDAYHNLHLPHNPPLYPTFDKVPPTSFTCENRYPGYYADIQTGCQAYHLCEKNNFVSFLCTNGTLFNEQFQVCDQFYNVRCGSPLIDL